MIVVLLVIVFILVAALVGRLGAQVLIEIVENPLATLIVVIILCVAIYFLK